MGRANHRRQWWPFVILAMFAHAAVLGVGVRYVPSGQTLDMQLPPIELVELPANFGVLPSPALVRPLALPEPQVLLEAEPTPEFDGQIVEIAKPDSPKFSVEPRFLAEYNSSVDEETRSLRFKINPEVLSPKYSDANHKKLVEEQNKPQGTPDATDGSVAHDPPRFDPKQSGLLAELPSPSQDTLRWGIANPTDGTEGDAELAGAPQNDRLDIKVGDSTRLNTKEFLYASYLLRIRRLVNYYWNQNLQNLPSSMPLSKHEYTTHVRAVLDVDGHLNSIQIAAACGSPELDEAVLRAFRAAGPYPNPPEGLVAKDGRVYLPNMGFTVTLGMAHAQYRGVDPRAGVRFPGLLGGPR